MTERPILFNGEMVRAIISGQKMQTRRVVKPPKNGAIIGFGGDGIAMASLGVVDDCEHITTVICPYGQAGDRLWVREAWAVSTVYDRTAPRDINPDGKPNWCGIYYPASIQPIGLRRRPAIHMPRWASRILLEIVSVRVERLQDISEADAVAEGCCAWSHSGGNDGYDDDAESTRDGFQRTWESTGAKWAANPWVWVVEFKRVEGGAA